MERLAAYDLAVKLASALGHISSQKIVHRDIKLANVMFRNDFSSPVLVDFGIVRNLSDSSLTQTWLIRGPGTPIFAPPEQLNNEKELIDWRSDQFSLGVLLYIAVFGKHPFEASGDSDNELIERVAAREQLPEQTRKKVLNSHLLPLAKMLEPWPVNRYRTAAALQNAWNEL